MKARVRILWIGEIQPDTFSQLIMDTLTEIYKEPCEFSHNAIELMYRPGEVWEATTPGGVRKATMAEATDKAAVIFDQIHELDCSEEVLDAYLAGEEGKSYALFQNARVLGRFGIIGWLRKILPAGTIDSWLKNGDNSRNCSEFVGRIFQRFSKKHVLTGDMDDWDPMYTFKFFKPGRCPKS
jgi:hypothetical protein